ncbi:sulfate ABC transporter substrate-binding protein [Nocardioides sp. GY 10113]|uniref:sulfate ABC transporter substrate-binding protein n=1 Tax=Nocardioides sp. GY 10113 TaxID=2569761 RepID=UPI0010A7719B|nr:sulfate ABC transporter substrate-binding protein [Nocardioides sp. GY 10113]TIC89287.1 sulfate ABC transporter substrate-binding protein [Nocardioides sp. GY 10113]
MKRTMKAAALAVTGTVALAGCTSTGAASTGSDLAVVAFSVMETANAGVYDAFERTDAGADVSFAPSYGPSGDQSRAVVAGARADVVHFSLETDVTRLVDEGLVAEDWRDTPTEGIATSSVVVLVVREGNPLGITGWDDLVKPGVELVTPNPGSSGAARWNILAAWAHVIGNGGTEAEAKEYVAELLAHTPVLPASGREATSAFVEGDQDVLLSYENEAILAKQNGEAIDYVVPEDTLLIQNPAAVTVGAADGAQEFLDFMESAPAQELYAGFGFRPVDGVDGVELPEVPGANDPADPFPAPAQLFTIDGDFGGWGEAGDKFFADGEDGEPVGIIPALIAASGSEAVE